MEDDVLIIGSYIAYLALSIVATVWVAQTLHRQGRIFLIESFTGNEPVAKSFNHLRAVGFYLISLGTVAVLLPCGARPTDLAAAIESVGSKIGVVLLVLAMLHFLSVSILSLMRPSALKAASPSAAPQQGVHP
jgi:hypothetical protein